MRTLFEPPAVYDRHRRIGAAGDDVRAFVRVAWIVYRDHFEAVIRADFLGVRLAILFCSAVDLNFLEFGPRQEKRLDVGARHAARADQAAAIAVVAGHILSPDARVASD